jgi:hypothetical protein
VYKYKLKEFEIGDVKIDKGIKSQVVGVDANTGAISWKIDYIPNIDKLVKDADELTQTAKGVYQKSEQDENFLNIYKQSRALRNSIRTHVRNNYPEEYKKTMNEGGSIDEDEIEEISTSGGAGGYLSKYAFKKTTKQKPIKETPNNPGKDLGPGPKATEDGVKDNAYVKQFKYKIVPKTNGTYVQKGSGLKVVKLF